MNPPTKYKYDKRDGLINYVCNNWNWLAVVAGVVIIALLTLK